MEYESNILKRLIDTYGVVGNPRYISEIIKEFIVRGKELYPQLFTYQSDWLAHIDEFGLTPEYTVSYTGQHIYAPNTLERPVKNAILKGNTTDTIIDFTGSFTIQNNVKDFNFLFFPKLNKKYMLTLELTDVTPLNGESDYIAVRGVKEDGSYDEIARVTQNYANGIYEIPITFNENYSKFRIAVAFKATIVNMKLKGELISVKMPVLTTSNTEFLTTLPISFFEENNPVSVTGVANFKLPRTFNDVTIKCKVNGLNQLRLNYNKSVTISNNDLKNGIEIKVDSLTDIGFHGDGIAYATKGNLVKWLKDGTIELGINEKGSELVDGYKIPYKSNILTVNEDVTLRSNGDVCDELNLLTGRLTQRIGEDGVVLSQEVIKTVDLNIKDQNNQMVNHLTSFEGGTHFYTSSQTGSVLPTLEVDVVVDLEETLMICSTEGNTM